MAFFDKMKGILDKSVEASKSAFNKAGDAVQDFGDKSVVKIEIKKLESQVEKKYTQIGKFVSDNKVAGKSFVEASADESFVELMTETENLLSEIDKRKASLADEKN